MEAIKKIIGTIFAILFIVTAVAALFLFNFDRSGFTAETYQKAFAREDFYAKLPTVLAETVASSNTDQSKFPLVMRGMSQSAWEAFFRSLLPPETLKVMGDEILSSTFAYLNRRTDSVTLSLTPLKTSLVTNTGVQAVFELLKTQADCTLPQIGQMTIDLLTGGDIEFCNPPESLIPLLTPVIKGELQVVALGIPDQLTFITAPGKNDPRDRLRVARLIMRFSPILPFAFLFLLTIFSVNSLRSWLNWWGFSFLITGGIATLMALSGAPVLGVVFERILINRMPAYLPPILLEYAGDLAAIMLKALLRPAVWEGLILACIGLLMILISYFVRRRAAAKVSS